MSNIFLFTSSSNVSSSNFSNPQHTLNQFTLYNANEFLETFATFLFSKNSSNPLILTQYVFPFLVYF